MGYDHFMMIQNRLSKNIKRLKSLQNIIQSNAFRLYDRDIPEFPYSIDLYNQHCVISHFYSSIDDEPEKIENLKATQIAISELLSIPIEQQFIKIRHPKKGKEQYQKLETKKMITTVNEMDAQLVVNLSDYLDTGLFLDHRPMRYFIRKFVKGKSFLNLFSYTSSVTVHAALAGATETLSWDLSQTYLDWSAENFILNKLSSENHTLDRVDCLNWAYQDTKVSKKFDVIFIDPPSFSNSKKMEDFLDVQRDHVALIETGIKHLNNDGVLFFSCNLRDFKMDSSILNNYRVYDLSAKTIPPDFRDQKIHHAFQIQRR